MGSKFFSFLLAVFCLIGFVSAWDICIDTQAPGTPEGLTVSGNVLLSWNEASDEPDCSGIDYYNIYLDDVLIGQSVSLSYSGSELADGNYVFEVSAVDKGGNEGEKAIKEVVFPQGSGITNNGNGGSSGGGGSSPSSGLPSSEGENSSSSGLSGGSSEGNDSYGMTLVDGGVENEGNNKGFFSTVTGAVTRVVGTQGGAVASVFVLLALGGFVAVKIRKKGK